MGIIFDNGFGKGLVYCLNANQVTQWVTTASAATRAKEAALSAHLRSATVYDYAEVTAAVTGGRVPVAADLNAVRAVLATPTPVRGVVPPPGPEQLAASRAEESRAGKAKKRNDAVAATAAKADAARIARDAMVTNQADRDSSARFPAWVRRVAEAFRQHKPFFQYHVTGFEFIDSKRLATESVQVSLLHENTAIGTATPFYFHYHEELPIVRRTGGSSKMHFKGAADPAVTIASLTYEEMESNADLKYLRDLTAKSLVALRPAGAETTFPRNSVGELLRKRQHTIVDADGYEFQDRHGRFPDTQARNDWQAQMTLVASASKTYI